jgi:hypothetical protein
LGNDCPETQEDAAFINKNNGYRQQGCQGWNRLRPPYQGGNNYNSNFNSNHPSLKDLVLSQAEINKSLNKKLASQDYLVAEEHFKAQFLKGFKKDRASQVKRVQDFMMLSFTLKNKQVEAIGNVSTSSSDLLSQLSSLMDQKIADAHKSTSDLINNLMR